MNSDDIIIGSVYLGDYSIDEAVGKTNINKWGNCTVVVKKMEGTIPHMHIISNKGYECCICIFEAAYFNH